MNIGVFSHFDESFKSVADVTVPIMKEYCLKHDYSFNALKEANCDRHPVWWKIKLLQDNLEKYDYLVYFDADTLITNFNISLESIIGDSDKNLFISNDINGLNSGVFIQA